MMSTLYLCVITYRHDGDRIVEIASRPTSKLAAIALLSQDIRLTFGSERIINGRVYSEADYRTHNQRRVAEAALVAL